MFSVQLRCLATRLYNRGCRTRKWNKNWNLDFGSALFGISCLILSLLSNFSAKLCPFYGPFHGVWWRILINLFLVQTSTQIKKRIPYNSSATSLEDVCTKSTTSNEMDSFDWKSRPRSWEITNLFLVTLLLYEIFNNNFYHLAWCYPKLLIGKNEDCNFYVAHVSLFGSITKE